MVQAKGHHCVNTQSLRKKQGRREEGGRVREKLGMGHSPAACLPWYKVGLCPLMENWGGYVAEGGILGTFQWKGHAVGFRRVVENG